MGPYFEKKNQNIGSNFWKNQEYWKLEANFQWTKY